MYGNPFRSPLPCIPYRETREWLAIPTPPRSRRFPFPHIERIVNSENQPPAVILPDTHKGLTICTYPNVKEAGTRNGFYPLPLAALL